MSGPTEEQAHEADRMPTDDEERAAEKSAEELQESGEEESVAEHYKDMAQRGVDQKGEGKIE